MDLCKQQIKLTVLTREKNEIRNDISISIKDILVDLLVFLTSHKKSKEHGRNMLQISVRLYPWNRRQIANFYFYEIGVGFHVPGIELLEETISNVCSGVFR